MDDHPVPDPRRPLTENPRAELMVGLAEELDRLRAEPRTVVRAFSLPVVIMVVSVLMMVRLGRPEWAMVAGVMLAVALGCAWLVDGNRRRLIGYGIGAGAWQVVEPYFFQLPGVSREAFDSVAAMYDRYDFGAVFFAGLTPFPYKVFTVSAGVFQINFVVFVVASAMSRGLRFFILAGLIYKFGTPIADFIDKYFNLLAWVFGFLLVGGFVAIEFLL